MACNKHILKMAVTVTVMDTVIAFIGVFLIIAITITMVIVSANAPNVI